MIQSQHLLISYIKQQPRWDVRYFDKKYLEVEQLLDTGKYVAEPLAKHVRQIVNFGAYSLCNLLVWVDDGIPYVRVTDLEEDGIDWEDVPKIPVEVHHQLPKSKVYSGDVLYSMAGTIGLAVVASEDLGECNSNQATAKIRLKPSNLNPHYLATFLNSRIGRLQSERIANGQTVLNINLGEIEQLRIPLPPRPIQDRIAQVMQDAYAVRRAKLAEANDLLAQIEDVVLKVLNISLELVDQTKRFSIQQVEMERWDVRYFLPIYQQLEQAIQQGKFETKSLHSLCTKLTNGLTPARSAYQDDGCTVIKVASLTRDYRIDWSKVAYTSQEFFRKAHKALVEPNDLLILSAAHQLDYIGRSFGLVREMPEDLHNTCMAVGELIIARVDKQKLLPDYLLACFATRPFQELVNRMTRGQSAHLYAEDLRNLQIPVPPKQVQQAIADEINRRRDTARRLRAEAEAVVAEAKARVERMILGEEAP